VDIPGSAVETSVYAGNREQLIFLSLIINKTLKVGFFNFISDMKMIYQNTQNNFSILNIELETRSAF
jgi:hypothetical protein